MLNFLVICALIFKFDSVFCASSEEQNAFLNWKIEFNIDYNDNETENGAFKTFCYNRKRIEDHNQQYFACNSSYALGLWKRSDVNTTVVNKQLNGLEPQLEVSGRAMFFINGIKIEDANVTSLNYVEMGYVTGVQDQGEICWCFRKLLE